MRPSYMLVDYENVHCLRTGTLTLRHSRTCGKPQEAACLNTEANVRPIAIRQSESAQNLPVITGRSWPSAVSQAHMHDLPLRPITCHSAPESEWQVAATSRYAGIHLAALHPLRWGELRPHSEACPICPRPRFRTPGSNSRISNE